MNIERATKSFALFIFGRFFSASFGQMLHSLYHQIADFVNSVFIHLVKKTERNVMGRTHGNYFLNKP